MKRLSKLLAIVLVAVGGATAAAGAVAVAVAASSPTVTTGSATEITDTDAVLEGTVNPDGGATDYQFDYGPTTAYGLVGTVHSAGDGTDPVSVKEPVAGLTPGTVYHYKITADNAAGAAAGADRTFVSGGHPPAAVVTGPAANVGVTVATPTGVINPEGAATTWVVEYGLTSAYTAQTVMQPALAPLLTPVPVSVQLTGLAPATLFHYAIVAYHDIDGVPTASPAGADQTFFTEPLVRPVPRVSARISARANRHAPFAFTATGSLDAAQQIPAAQRCTGDVAIRVYNGSHRLADVVAPLSATCAFSAPVSFRRDRGRGRTLLKVTIDYLGNGYVAPADHTGHLTVG